MKKYYDKKKKALVYIGKSSTPIFWDKKWDVKEFKKQVMSVRDGVYVNKITRKYLDKKSKILEGGCGKGQYVYALKKWGYDSYGIDYAPSVIKRINNIFTNLNIQLADVRRLPFADNFFDGYWSFGVIEHFYNGYQEIVNEMKRVVRKGGYIFITFLHLSKIRKYKIKHGKFLKMQSDININNFYQFALDWNYVREFFESNDFEFIEKKYLDGIKGLKDEIIFGKKGLQKIYDSNKLSVKIVKFMINFITKSFTSHSILLVFKVK